MRVHVRAALVRIADNRDCFCGGLEDKGNLWPRRTKPLPLARRLWNSLAATVSEVADSLSGEIFLSAYNKRDRSVAFADPANRGTASPRIVDSIRTKASETRLRSGFIRELTPSTRYRAREIIDSESVSLASRESCCR